MEPGADSGAHLISVEFAAGLQPATNSTFILQRQKYKGEQSEEMTETRSVVD